MTGGGGRGFGRCLERVLRRKAVVGGLDTPLQRVYSTLDLVLLGIGSMVGSGIYVIVGKAARDLAGPGIILSFLLAGIVAVLTGLCFAEFATRVPKTGSSYLYTYNSLGEIWAFLVGWGILVVIMLSGATQCKAWSAYFDSLLDRRLQNLTETYVGSWKVGPPVAPYPDLVAFLLVWLVTAVVALGANCTARFNHVFAALNICVLMFVSIAGFVKADIKNWTGNATGGFLPFGFKGVLQGSSSCFWAFTGFEIIAISNEEARDPTYSMPRATVFSVLFTALLYVGTAAGLTLMTSYRQLDPKASLPHAFVTAGMDWGRYVAAVGPLLGLTTALVTSMYAYTRLVYAMADDGLLPAFMGRLSRRTSTPVLAVLLGGAVMSLVALTLDLHNMLSFAVNLQLMQYLLICSCVVLLRYRPPEDIADVPTVRWSAKRGYHSDSEDEAVLLDVPRAIKHSSDESHENQSPRHRRDSGDDHQASDDSLESSQPYRKSDSENQESPERNGDIKLKTKKMKRKDSSLNFQDQDSGKSVDTKHSNKNQQVVFSHRSDFSSGHLRNSFSCFRKCWFPWCANCALVVFLFGLLALVCTLVFGYQQGRWGVVAMAVIMGLVCLLMTMVLVAHRQNVLNMKFKVPCVPVLPLTADLLIIIIAVTSATPSSWIGCIIVFALGGVVYFVYGFRHSRENKRHLSGVTTEEEAGLLNEK